MKITVVVTVFNEVATILGLLRGLLRQTYPAAEVIIVDANSTDKTVQLIKVFQKKYPQLNLKLFIHPGNRSQGRNFAIAQVSSQWLAITDAGCIPHRKWLEQLAKQAVAREVEVVAGFYEATSETAFQAAVAPYMLVMPDRINSNHFLPATRSMLIKKSAWEKVGGFNENLKVSEDYDFSHRLEQAGVKMSFAAQALVAWRPLATLSQFYQTVRDMAYYDAQAGLIRMKVYFIFYRYLVFLFLGGVFFYFNYLLGWGFVILSSVIYFLWAMWKNAQYVDGGWLYLPLLQVVSDVGVMTGMGKFSRVKML